MYHALVVLGAGFRADGSVSPALVRRARHAARLYHAGRAPAVLVTGGANPRDRAPYAEAEAMARILVALDVPNARIVAERRARNTAENARLAAELLDARGWTRVGVVTDPAHMPRAVLAFRRAGLTPAPERVPDAPSSAVTRLREAVAYVVYLVRYDAALRARI